MPKTIVHVIVLLAGLGLALPAVAEKIKIEKLDDLPRHTYEVSKKPSELLTADEEFADLLAQVKKNVLEVLDTYEIDDGPTLQGFYRTLTAISFWEQDYEKVLEYVELGRELEEKEAQKYMAGRVAEAFIKTRGETAAPPGSDEFGATFLENYRAQMKDVPWEKVQDLVQQQSGQMQIMSENLLVGMLQGSMDVSFEKSGFLSGDQARGLVQMRSMMETIFPVKDQVVEVLSALMASHKEDKQNIWPDRNVAFTGEEGYSPAVVAVWDAGTDHEVFKGMMYTNRAERFDGEDNDANGYVDDVHGIAYDILHNKSPEPLYLNDQAGPRRDELEGYIKGFMDLQAGIDSEDAVAIRAHIAGLEPEDVKPFVNSVNLYAHYAHGTHVAGISIEGNPYAKVLAARLSFDHRMTPIPYTQELAEKFGEMFKESVQYFKEHDVRVVNMSWGFSLQELESTLEANGIGKDSEERGQMAREMFKVARKGLKEAFESAPEICFIAAAGNADNDIQFDEFIPSGFELPNLLTVGAVDQAGEATGFTSFGKNVVVYGNGFEVENYVPGGNRVKMSGTSMASPHVANLATKLVAVDPSLEPKDVFQLIKEGAEDRGEADQAMLVIHPGRSVELLKERMTKSE